MSIFDYIENKSHDIACKLGENETEDDIELYEYSVFMILSHLLTFGVATILSLIFGYFWNFIIIYISFALLRRGSGGYHCETFMNCFCTTNILFMISGILSLNIINQFKSFDVSMIFWYVSLFCCIFIMPVCPKPTINSPSRGYSEDIRFRKKYRNALIVLSILSLISLLIYQVWISISISFGMLIVCFLTSNIGEHILNFIWGSKGGNT